MKRKRIIVFTTVFFLFAFNSLCFGGGGTRHWMIDLVKESYLKGYSSAPLGKILERVFDDPKWQTATGKKGRDFVIFSGKVTDIIRKDAIATFVPVADSWADRDINVLLQKVFASIGKERFREIVTQNRRDSVKATEQVYDEAFPGFWKVGSEVKIYFVITAKDDFSVHDFEVESEPWWDMDLTDFWDVIYR